MKHELATKQQLLPEIRRNCTIVADGPSGGYLDVVSPYGEIVHQFFVPQGRHNASHWLDLVEAGYQLQIASGCVCFQPRMGAVVSGHPLMLSSDANPDFVPTSEYRNRIEMNQILGDLREARLALNKAARLQKADEVKLLETIPEPKPMAKAKPKAEADAVVQE